jgi:prepilin-type N-terminal cleavage/methylation domain-containing protein
MLQSFRRSITILKHKKSKSQQDPLCLRANKNAFTLIELMLSLALVLIASAGMLEAINAANILSIEARESTIAMNDARSIVERIKITPLSSLPNGTTVNASSIWADLNSFVSNSLSNQQITVTGTTGVTLRQLTVSISWRGPRNKLKTIQFVTKKSFFNG